MKFLVVTLLSATLLCQIVHCEKEYCSPLMNRVCSKLQSNKTGCICSTDYDVKRCYVSNIYNKEKCAEDMADICLFFCELSGDLCEDLCLQNKNAEDILANKWGDSCDEDQCKYNQTACERYEHYIDLFYATQYSISPHISS